VPPTCGHGIGVAACPVTASVVKSRFLGYFPAMLCPDGKFKDHWRTGQSVPDGFNQEDTIREIWSAN